MIYDCIHDGYNPVLQNLCIKNNNSGHYNWKVFVFVILLAVFVFKYLIFELFVSVFDLMNWKLIRIIKQQVIYRGNYFCTYPNLRGAWTSFPWVLCC